MEEIGDYAFGSCLRLSSVKYQNKNLIFPNNAFSGCHNLNKDSIIYETPKEQLLLLANNGDAESQYQLAMCYIDGTRFTQNYDEAKKWLEKASEKGHSLSQKTLGDIYLNGTGVKKNSGEALKWYTLAANGGNISAQTILGDFYFQGTGVKQNFPSAIKYYKMAADQGDDKAAEILGQCYYFGYGCNKDYQQAFKWFDFSANKDNAEAAYYLATCYNQGTGTDKNDSEALKWIEKAVDGGVEKAKGLYCILTYDDAVKNMNSGYYSLAISEFSTLLIYDSENIDAYINRGYCYLNQKIKNYPKAEEDFKKALELDVDNETARNNLQVVKDYYQRINEAKKLCDLGDKYYDQRDYVNAVANYAKSISLDNTKPYTYYSLGYCYFDNELYADAIKYFDLALSVDPNYTNAIKARRSARTIAICNAISQVASAVSNSLNTVYNSSIDYSNSNSYSSSSYTSTTSSTKTVCSLCGGTGHIDGYVATFGDTDEKWCDYCKKWMPASHCCQCKTCPSCNGRGYK